MFFSLLSDITVYLIIQNFIQQSVDSAESHDLRVSMPDVKFTPAFEMQDFLASAGIGRRTIHVKNKGIIFSQGSNADAVFYILKGRAKLTVVSQNGKEATISLLTAKDFVGEEAIAAIAGYRLASATAITACTVVKIERQEMIRVIREEQNFSHLFHAFLLARSMRTQADLVDQLFNSSEKRLARILLLMADFGKAGEPETLIPKISQQTLAEMIGTTRARVSFFMNRFREHGFVEYNGRIHVNKSLLNVVLHDHFDEGNVIKPVVFANASEPFPSSKLRKKAKA